MLSLSLVNVLDISRAKSPANTFAAVLGMRSCSSKSAALSKGHAMNRRCIEFPRRRLVRDSRLIPW